MFLSSFQFNPARRDARRLLSSPHAIHAAVLAGFPDAAPLPGGRVLWRIDRQTHGARLIIVSPTRPDLTHLAEQAGWPTLDDAWRSTSYLPLLQRVEEGHEYRFRLTANPTHTVRPEHGGRGRPVGHVTAEQQVRWLLERQERAGFRILDTPEGAPALVVKDRDRLRFRRRETEVVLDVATFEGAIEVVDRAQFVSVLCNGLGRAKGYGCGLLTIAAVR